MKLNQVNSICQLFEIILNVIHSICLLFVLTIRFSISIFCQFEYSTNQKIYRMKFVNKKIQMQRNFVKMIFKFVIVIAIIAIIVIMNLRFFFRVYFFLFFSFIFNFEFRLFIFIFDFSRYTIHDDVDFVKIIVRRKFQKKQMFRNCFRIDNEQIIFIFVNHRFVVKKIEYHDYVTIFRIINAIREIYRMLKS